MCCFWFRLDYPEEDFYAAVTVTAANAIPTKNIETTSKNTENDAAVKPLLLFVLTTPK